MRRQVEDVCGSLRWAAVSGNSTNAAERISSLFRVPDLSIPAIVIPVVGSNLINHPTAHAGVNPVGQAAVP